MTNEKARGTSVWVWLWILPYLGSAALALRLVYEQTILSWSSGPQMVGFALAHSEIVGPAIFLATAALTLWCAVAGAYFLWARFASSARATRPLGRLLRVSFLTLALIAIPERIWRFTLVATIGPGSNAAEWLSYAAAVGDLATVRVLLSRGVPVDVRNHDGATALIGTGVEGQMRVAEYLLAHGADPNARTALGTTSLSAAAEMGHLEVAELLVHHGAAFPCTGSALVSTNASIAARGDEFHIFASSDSSRRRSAAKTDSVLARWATTFDKHPPSCGS